MTRKRCTGDCGKVMALDKFDNDKRYGRIVKSAKCSKCMVLYRRRKELERKQKREGTFLYKRKGELANLKGYEA